jgi:hypothetical protein
MINPPLLILLVFRTFNLNKHAACAFNERVASASLDKADAYGINSSWCPTIEALEIYV